MDRYDIAIIGGGPAGLTFARLIDPRYKVILIEKRDWDKDDVKACGGLLAPDAQHELTRQRIGIPKDVLVGPQLFNVKAVDLDAKRTRFYPRHYINIDRKKFDDFLRGMIGNHILMTSGTTLKDMVPHDGQWQLSLEKGGEKRQIQTRWVIGADGANSWIRKKLFPTKDRLKRYICIQEWFDLDFDLTSYEALFSKTISDYYAWIIPKNQQLIVGAALMSGPQASSRFEALKNQIFGDDQQTRVCRKREGHYLTRPSRFTDIKLFSKNAFLIGEAAGLVSPSSGEGISYALQSGRILAQAFNRSENHIDTTYRRQMLKTRWKLAMKIIKGKVIYHPLSRRLVMGLGIGTIKDISVDTFE